MLLPAYPESDAPATKLRGLVRVRPAYNPTGFEKGDNDYQVPVASLFTS